MKHLVIMLGLVGLAACATGGTAGVTRTARGHALAETQCGACHATGHFDESRAPEAPPLRLLSLNYRVANLEEALAEGISVGHPAMPAFTFEPEDVDALIAYLQSIQERP
jgi:mono/diheme cytochrome c family protein